MGDQLSCSSNCTPNCISRGHPPGTERPEEEGHNEQRVAGRSYPIADPIDAHLNWQTIAVRHAWKRATEGDLQGGHSGAFNIKAATGGGTSLPLDGSTPLAIFVQKQNEDTVSGDPQSTTAGDATPASPGSLHSMNGNLVNGYLVREGLTGVSNFKI
mmetsp:Transcript_100358/g.189340  ORF Transcript_100358/g.189340 Transcript_100358/m.189340 type:complete len:157 (-) Transcript_100358:116-586(-)